MNKTDLIDVKEICNMFKAQKACQAMSKIEMIKLLAKNALEYRKNGVLKSLKRNFHMNEYDGEKIKKSTIDAILVDFLNFIASYQGVDLGLYTKDFNDPEGMEEWLKNE